MSKNFQDPGVDERMTKIKRKILVLSGKGGVGKSTVAVNLAVALASKGNKVGLLDVDIHGPSVPKLMGVEGVPLRGTEHFIEPLGVHENLKLMSIGFLLRGGDDAVIWRGPMKFNVIKQFLSDVNWGELDYLVVDSPPGTGDEPLAVAQLIGNSDGAVIVTTPQGVAITDVRKCITFCRQLELPVIGVVENMSGFVCPHCKEKTEIFKAGGGEEMAGDMGVPFLGRVPIDPGIVSSSDEGKPFMGSGESTATVEAFTRISEALAERVEKRERSAGEAGKEKKEASPGDKGEEEKKAGKGEVEPAPASSKVRIAVPVTGGRIAEHFGHCEQFALIDADPASASISATEMSDAPPHQPGALPEWLEKRGANVIIACGMGSRARDLFQSKGIDVIIGASKGKPEEIAEAYLKGELQTGQNICDH